MRTSSVTPVVATGLHKRYGKLVALERVDLRIEPGEVFGLLGPNGAGKSTAVKILVGLVRPTAGTVELFGRPARDPEARRHVGYLPELFRFHPSMTGRQLLRFHADLAGLPEEVAEASIPEALQRVGMDRRADERIGTYSKGMSQRIGLAQAILGKPRLVLLDEPTSALDPVGRREVRDIIRGLRAEGSAVVLNSHLLGEVEHVCDRAAVLDRGTVVFQGPLSALTGGGPRLEIRVDRIDGDLVRSLSRFGSCEVVDQGTALITLTDADAAGDVAAAVVAAGRRLLAMVPVGISLEDAFVGLVQGGDR